MIRPPLDAPLTCPRPFGLEGALVLAAALAVSSCASSRVGQLRFHNQPPVWRVNDRRPISQPKNRVFAHFLYVNDGYALRRIPRLLEFQGGLRALGVNALDEVPDSTWFTNRIGLHDMTVDQVRRGPNTLESPERHRPWIVLGTKVGGASPGFIIKDQRGERYLLKFDEKGFPEMETAAGIIIQRILHACGYNVPEDYIVLFKKRDMVLARDATVKDFYGNKRPMTDKDLRDNLARINVGKDGSIRGMVSRFLPGVPIGGISLEGTRPDDPNDVIPHDRRRDLRGQAAIYSWLHHTDIKEDNTLDIWTEDPRRKGHSYVVHYLLDFGKALGVMGFMEKRRQVGFAHSTDVKYLLQTLPTLGLLVRPWERIEQPRIPAIGLIDSKNYRPDLYTTNLPYFPISSADRFDNLWGARILIRFTPAMIRAVVEEARYSDPRSTEYMVKVLLERQRIAARYWFGKVNPLDRFAILPRGDQARLCFDDLLLKYRLQDRPGATRYVAEAYGRDGAAAGWKATATPGPNGRTCIDGLTPPAVDDGYLVIQIDTRRPGTAHGQIHLHLARDPATGKPRIIGLRRR